jgi:hypothetical protein
MTSKKIVLAVALACFAGIGATGQLQAGWGVGVRVGGPVYYRSWDPYYYPYYSYYPYRAVYVEPPPVVVESAPLVVQPAPVAQPVSPSAPSTLPPPAILRSSQIQNASQPDVDRYVQQLRDPDERTRADGVLQLGRLRVVAKVDSVAATLAGDRSPVVREAAARALGLMGSPKALPALQRAASADPDRDVRHSAQFALDIIQSGR